MAQIKGKTLKQLKSDNLRSKTPLKPNDIFNGNSILNLVLKEELKVRRIQKDVDLLRSKKDKVEYFDYDERVSTDISKIVDDLELIFGKYADDETPKKASRVVRVGDKKKPGAAKGVVNFRIRKVSTGGTIPTAIQERGSSFIFDMVLRKNKRFNSAQDILADNEISKTLYEDIFRNYEDRVVNWIYTYYEQQRLFLDKYKSVKWDKFVYGNKSFVKFFEDNIKNIYLQFDPVKKFQKYEQWNPADIYAAYDMPKIKRDLDSIFQGKENQKGVNLFRLNTYLIDLFSSNKLVGISLKKINEPDEAEIIARNIDAESYLAPEIETKQYTMDDIDFVIDGIYDEKRKTVSTYIKFSKDYSIDIKGSSSKFNNLAFGTSIKAKSAAQGGNAPIELVIGLMKKNGSDIKFKNDNSQYPKTDDEFYVPKSSMYKIKDYETWFNVVKKQFSNKNASFRDFEFYIAGLYEDGDGAIAQSKLMQLHFYYDSLKTNKLGKNYWLKILYLGMKIGKRFAPHQKIY